MAQLLVGGGFAVFAVGGATSQVIDGDVFWIAAAGRDVLATGAVPRTNAWSFTAPDHAWLNHEWLFGPLYALGLGAMGPAFFALAALAIVTAGAALVAMPVARRSRYALTTALVSSLTLLCFSKRLLTPRPSGVTLLFALGLLAIASKERLRWRDAAALVALELAWTNAHGSFPLGVAIILAGALFARAEGRASRIALGAAALAAAVTVVNPYGLGLHRLVASYFRGDEGGTFAFIHAHIEEFAPIWRGGGGTLGAPELVGLAIVSAATALALASKEHRARGAFCAALAVLAALHVRHAEQYGLLSAVTLAPMLDGALARRGVTTNPLTRSDVLLALAPGAIVALLGLGAATRARAADDWIAPSLGGAAVARFARELPAGARASVPFDASGVFLWYARARPRGVRVLYDERNDCYPREVAEAAYALDHRADGAAEVLDRYGADHALAARGGPLDRALGGAPGWTLASGSEGVRWYARAPR